jgi:hypothetical protein
MNLFPNMLLGRCWARGAKGVHMFVTEDNVAEGQQVALERFREEIGYHS